MMDVEKSIGGLPPSGSTISVERVQRLKERLEAEGMPVSMIQGFVKSEWTRIGIEISQEIGTRGKSTTPT